MPNQQRNGSRNVAVPDENRPTWRPTDEYGRRNRRSMSEEDERYMRDREEDDRYMQRDRFSHWDERRDRDEGYRRDDRDDDRSTERYGQGQSGYGAGRYEEDRSYGSRNMGYPRGFDEHPRERGLDERFSQGRGGSSWERDRDGDRSERWGNEGYSSTRDDRGRMRGQHQEGGMYGHGPGSWSQPSHRGKGPSSYTRSDERIRETVCEALTDDHDVDATHIEVTVKNGEVILSGTVQDRRQKRMAEDCAEQVNGVKDVQNQLRVATDRKDGKDASSRDTETSTTTSTTDKKHRA